MRHNIFYYILNIKMAPRFQSLETIAFDNTSYRCFEMKYRDTEKNKIYILWVERNPVTGQISVERGGGDCPEDLEEFVNKIVII
jgi:hypothetical protein